MPHSEQILHGPMSKNRLWLDILGVSCPRLALSTCWL
jgi:hypothetical protein